MCLAVPLKIVEINGLDAVGEVEGLRRRMRLDFIRSRSWASTSSSTLAFLR